MEDNPSQTKELLEVVEASDRAGSLVAEHVRALIHAAEVEAEHTRSNAEADARRIVQQAVESAARVLAAIEAVDGPLSQIVADLRKEADRLTTNTGTEAP
jgi:hypothetical protein